MASSIHCLFRLARKYLSVQATSTPAERVMSSMGIVLEKRRQSMTGRLFAEMLVSTCQNLGGRHKKLPLDVVLSIRHLAQFVSVRMGFPGNCNKL